MKSAVENLSPTRVRLTVEVPFDELKPSLEAAYRKVAQEVRIKGFRPGKVPPPILDQRVGRGAILQEAVSDALPRFYGEAVRENQVRALGHPEVEVTEFADGAQLAFTAEVDVRPEFELPAYEGIEVTVDVAEPSEEDVDQQVEALRDRFAVLATAERAAESGDYVLMDIETKVGEDTVDEASGTSISYEVGSGSAMPGLDDAITGMSAGDTKSFGTALTVGSHSGSGAEVTVTVRSVKSKQLPELDDDFAQTASEFDTLEELRADVRSRLTRVKRLEQGLQARDKVLEALLARTDVPLPEHVLADDVEWRRRSLDEQLAAAGLTKEEYAGSQGQTVEQVDEEVDAAARNVLRQQFVLDAIATKEELSVSEPELTEHILRRAQQARIGAEQLARQIVENGQLPSVMAEVLRAKALAVVLESARVTDAAGEPVDLEALRPRADAADSAAPDSAAADTAEPADTAAAAETPEPADG